MNDIAPPDDSCKPEGGSRVMDAWDAYAATYRMMAENPSLARNDYFKALQDAACARFIAVFDAMGVD